MARKLKVDTAAAAHQSSWDPEKALAQALAERSQFLETYPQYRTFQAEIDRMLDKAGSADNRMAVLAMLIEGKLVELSQEFKKLNNILTRMN